MWLIQAAHTYFLSMLTKNVLIFCDKLIFCDMFWYSALQKQRKHMSWSSCSLRHVHSSTESLTNFWHHLLGLLMFVLLWLHKLERCQLVWQDLNGILIVSKTSISTLDSKMWKVMIQLVLAKTVVNAGKGTNCACILVHKKQAWHKYYFEFKEWLSLEKSESKMPHNFL